MQPKIALTIYPLQNVQKYYALSIIVHSHIYEWNNYLEIDGMTNL